MQTPELRRLVLEWCAPRCISAADSQSTVLVDPPLLNVSVLPPPSPPPFVQAEDLRKMAEACQEDGCSVETVSSLLDQLKAKKKELQVHTTCVLVEDRVLTLRNLDQAVDQVLKQKLP